jgi:hypothetical protein
VPVPEGNGKLEKQGRFSRKDFSYDSDADTYRCPAGELLHPTKGRWQNTSGRVEIRYLSRKATCGSCPLRARCLNPKVPYRTIARWEHEDVLERHRARMQSAGELMRRRSAIVEHPFGTLKCRAGYRHFLLRGFNKVRGEWSLMALCYNFTRVLNILGLADFVACLTRALALFQQVIAAILSRVQALLSGFWRHIARSLLIRRTQLAFVG